MRQTGHLHTDQRVGLAGGSDLAPGRVHPSTLGVVPHLRLVRPWRSGSPTFRVEGRAAATARNVPAARFHLRLMQPKHKKLKTKIRRKSPRAMSNHVPPIHLLIADPALP